EDRRAAADSFRMVLAETRFDGCFVGVSPVGPTQVIISGRQSQSLQDERVHGRAASALAVCDDRTTGFDSECVEPSAEDLLVDESSMVVDQSVPFEMTGRRDMPATLGSALAAREFGLAARVDNPFRRFEGIRDLVSISEPGGLKPDPESARRDVGDFGG